MTTVHQGIPSTRKIQTQVPAQLIHQHQVALAAVLRQLYFYISQLSGNAEAASKRYQKESIFHVKNRADNKQTRSYGLVAAGSFIQKVDKDQPLWKIGQAAFSHFTSVPFQRSLFGQAMGGSIGFIAAAAPATAAQMTQQEWAKMDEYLEGVIKSLDAKDQSLSGPKQRLADIVSNLKQLRRDLSEIKKSCGQAIR